MNRSMRSRLRATTAVPQLLYPETMMRSGFFLKKKPPTMKLNRLRKLWNRSRLAFLLLPIMSLQLALRAQPPSSRIVAVTIVDETGAAVADAQITLEEPGRAAVRLATNYAGHASFTLAGNQPYSLRVQKPGFY